ncbi:diacylglycerol/polyprenol kinase family protein [Longibacter sp.]|uniref:diacylglycerol/polyprenol kinase family protein n=1 Tax=Longibacter sp. TaxID=2045415 RepID=UPI003EBB7794
MSDTSTAPPSPSSSPAPQDSERPFGYQAELKRKALHLLALVVPLGMHLLGRDLALWILIPVTSMAVGADVLRAYWQPFNQHIRTIFGPLMRTEELPDVGGGVVINGATSVLISGTLLTLFVPLRIAVPVFVMTMIADAAAALVGRAIGRHRWPGRSHTVEGSLAFVASGLLVLAFFPLSWTARIAATFSAAVAEAAPLPVNDNIAVPLIAAAVVWGIGM